MEIENKEIESINHKFEFKKDDKIILLILSVFTAVSLIVPIIIMCFKL